MEKNSSISRTTRNISSMENDLEKLQICIIRKIWVKT